MSDDVQGGAPAGERAQRPFGPFSRLCRIPRSLAAVTSRGKECAPREVGLEPRAVAELWKGVEDTYRTGLYPAVQVCIRCEDRVVLDRSLGHVSGNGPEDARDAEKQLATTRTPFVIYSASKAVTAMLILKLDELGVLHLEDRVADYLPDFARHGKDQITIRHVLAHRAGIPAMPAGPEMLAYPDRVLELLCDARPVSRPGRFLSYHAISGGFILGAVAERATGDDLRLLLRRHVGEPLGLEWMNYGVEPERADQVAIDAFTGPPVLPPVSWLLQRALGASVDRVVRIANGVDFRAAVVPAGNVVTTAGELSRFYMCLANEGRLGEARVFDPRTVRRATSEQSYYELDWTLGAPIRWGLGLMLGGAVSLFGVDTPAAFGHLGFTNILGWADPERRLGVAIFTSGKPVVSLGALALGRWVLRVSRTFPKKGTL